MNKQTWVFHEAATIPGIPGEWHAGLDVDIDTDTMTVLETRLRGALIEEVQQVAPQEKAAPTVKKTVGAKEAKGDV